MEDRLESEKFDDNRPENISDKSPAKISDDEINDSSILGRHFKLPDFSKSFDHDPPKLDSSLPYIPVYTHLITHDLVEIERPKTPPFIRRLRSGRAMQSKNRSKSTVDPTVHETDDQDEEMICHSGRSSKSLKSNETRLQND